jgi:AraC-like DNA-binding protein
MSGVHVIPDMLEDGDIQYNTFHTMHSEHPLYLLRRNEIIPKFNNPVSRNYPDGSHILNLINYAVDCFVAQADENLLRLLARVLFYEVYKLIYEFDIPEDKYPKSFVRMLNHIEDYLELPIDIAQLSFHGNLSSASIYRAFKKYLDTTPQKYIIHRRLIHAAKVLQTSTVSIASLARSLQFSTSGNFSRAFRQKFGVSPRKFRERGGDDAISAELHRQPRHIGDAINPHFVPLFIPESELN